MPLIRLDGHHPARPLASSCVSTPSPGPTSITMSSGVSSAAATMRSSTRLSTRKCWPRPFLARRSCCASSLLGPGDRRAPPVQTPQLPVETRIRVVHPPSTPASWLTSCRTAPTRRPCGTQKLATYRCFLPDLTGFIAFCRTGPDLQHHSTEAVPQGHRASGGNSAPL